MSQYSLRLSLRHKRKSLSKPQRYRCHKRILHNLFRGGILRHTHIGIYHGFDGEVDTSHIINTLQQYGKKLYVPKLQGRTLGFTKVSHHLSTNKFGINESRGKKICTKQLTCIITPLVGFDTLRNRMGMGMGYYDTTLAFINSRKHYDIPKRVGIAYEIQHTTLIPNTWDVRLSYVVTEQRIY